MKEVVISAFSDKICSNCGITFPCNLEHFPKNSTRMRDGIRITYLRSACRKCWSERPNKPKASRENLNKNALNWYKKNRDEVNRKKRKKNLIKRLTLFFGHRVEKNGWKLKFNEVINNIKKA